jgi:hypothetical protein
VAGEAYVANDSREAINFEQRRRTFRTTVEISPLCFADRTDREEPEMVDGTRARPAPSPISRSITVSRLAPGSFVKTEDIMSNEMAIYRVVRASAPCVGAYRVGFAAGELGRFAR